MPTKAGMVKESDCVNGKTFYLVQITLDSGGGFEISIKPHYCLSRAYKRPIKKSYDVYSKEFFRKNSIVSFDCIAHGKAYKNADWSGSPFSHFNNPLTKCSKHFNYLFITRAYAERFVTFLNLMFKTSDEQQWHVHYQNRWEMNYYNEEMERLCQTLDGVVEPDSADVETDPNIPPPIN